MLDIDSSKSIKDFEITINTKYLSDAIYKLIELIKKYGLDLGSVNRETGIAQQFKLGIKYLGVFLPIIFEFDHTFQYIYILLYSADCQKTLLKLFVSITEGPIIKYVENDRSGQILPYQDANIYLKPGEYLINFAHAIFSYIGFDRMSLEDDSYLNTIDPKTGTIVKTKLWLYSLLTKGKSWYSKFGYVPANHSMNEYNLRIMDVQKISLKKVIITCKIIVDYNYSNSNLVAICASIINILDKTLCTTLREYALSESIFDYALLIQHMSIAYLRNLS